MIAVIAAVAANGVIGREGHIPWDLPEDRRRFREITTGHMVVMGRRTYEEIGHPLPGRRTILVSSRLYVEEKDCRTVSSFEDAEKLLEKLGGTEDIFICGGASLYQAFLPKADRIYLTEIHREVEGDVFFPVWNRSGWREAFREERGEFAFVEYVREPLFYR